MRSSVNKSQSGGKNTPLGSKNSNQKVKKEVPTAWRDRISPEDY